MACVNFEPVMLKYLEKMASQTYRRQLLCTCFLRMANRVRKLFRRRAIETKPTLCSVWRKKWYTTTSTYHSAPRYCVIPSSTKAVSTNPSAPKPARSTVSIAMPSSSTSCTHNKTVIYMTSSPRPQEREPNP